MKALICRKWLLAYALLIGFGASTTVGAQVQELQTLSFHFDKIVFSPTEETTFVCGPRAIDPTVIDKTRYTFEDWLDIKVLDDPFAVADLRQKTANFLRSVGCTRKEGKVIQKKHIFIRDVEYAICQAVFPLIQIDPDEAFRQCLGLGLRSPD